MNKISEQGLLEVLADFDEHGGASLGLIAWETFHSEQEVLQAWELAISRGWVAPAGLDDVYDERLWRLTERGWEVHRRALVRHPEREPGDPDLGPDPGEPG